MTNGDEVRFVYVGEREFRIWPTGQGKWCAAEVDAMGFPLQITRALETVELAESAVAAWTKGVPTNTKGDA